MKKVVRAVFDNPHDLSPEQVADSQELKKLIKSQAPEAVRLAFDHDKKFATIFEINDSSCFIDVPKKNWIPALETCLLWYVEEENYEMCTKIKDLINEIKNGRGKNKLNLDDDREGF